MNTANKNNAEIKVAAKIKKEETEVEANNDKKGTKIAVKPLSKRKCKLLARKKTGSKLTMMLKGGSQKILMKRIPILTREDRLRKFVDMNPKKLKKCRRTWRNN